MKRPRPDIVSPEQALHRLFLAVFSGEELRRWMSHNYGIAGDLPAELASVADLADKAVAALGRRGWIDDNLFKRLRIERPGQARLIAEVAVLWGLTLDERPEIISGVPHQSLPTETGKSARKNAPKTSGITTALAATSFLVPFITGISTATSAEFIYYLIAAFLIGPVACVALILRHNIAFLGGLVGGIKALDLAQRVPLFCAASTLGAGASALVAQNIPDEPQTIDAVYLADYIPEASSAVNHRQRRYIPAAKALPEQHADPIDPTPTVYSPRNGGEVKLTQPSPSKEVTTISDPDFFKERETRQVILKSIEAKITKRCNPEDSKHHIVTADIWFHPPQGPITNDIHRPNNHPSSVTDCIRNELSSISVPKLLLEYPTIGNGLEYSGYLLLDFPALLASPYTIAELTEAQAGPEHLAIQNCGDKTPLRPAKANFKLSIAGISGTVQELVFLEGDQDLFDCARPYYQKAKFPSVLPMIVEIKVTLRIN